MLKTRISRNTKTETEYSFIFTSADKSRLNWITEGTGWVFTIWWNKWSGSSKLSNPNLDFSSSNLCNWIVEKGELGLGLEEKGENEMWDLCSTMYGYRVLVLHDWRCRKRVRDIDLICVGWDQSLSVWIRVSNYDFWEIVGWSPSPKQKIISGVWSCLSSDFRIFGSFWLIL